MAFISPSTLFLEPPAAEPKPEVPKDNIFRPETVTLTGPQVLGTMDVSGFVAGGKHKRKRLQKEKVDVSKAPKGNAQGGGNRQKYRVIDFKRNKLEMEGEVVRLEYAPNRSAFKALIKNEDGELR